MSSFKQRLTELFEHEYGEDKYLLTQSNFFNPKSKLKFTKPQQPKVPFKENPYINYNEQSSQKTSPTTNSILNKSVISPYYNEKPSFYFRASTRSTDTQRHLRLNSANKYQSRIRREIDLLSDSFRTGINPLGKMNRPLVIKDKKENNDFSINYVATISSYRDSAKERKGNVASKRTAKKMDLIYDLIRDK
jgi:hypothetical protein